MGVKIVVELCAAVLLGCGLARRRSVWEGTTLGAPRRWALAAVAIVVAVDLWIAWMQPDGTTRSAVRYAADTLLLTPFIALLGAKRPQDQGWQWIVVSLWGVLLVPLAQWLAFGQGTFRLHLTWQVFMAILVLAQLANFSGTSQFSSAVVWSLGQWVLLAPALHRLMPFESMTSQPGVAWGRPLGMTLLAGAAWWAGTLAGNWDRRGRSWDRAWLDFRDLYGAAWGLRVLERINQPAELAGWPVRLNWSRGFTETEGAAGDPSRVDQPEWTHEIDRAMRTVLRRFVSPNWLNDRLPSGPAAAGASPDDTAE
ncbi:MAG: hypothetical protein U0795_16120 [Pirellulales bacterium]